MKFRHAISLFLLILLTLQSGCSLIKTDQEIKEIDSAVTITGKILNAKNPDTPIVIGLFKKEKEKEKERVKGQGKKNKYTLLQSTVVYGNSAFEFLTEEDSYYVAAFADINQDFILQKNESAGWYGKPSALKVISGKQIPPIQITLKPPAEVNIDMPSIYDANYQQLITLKNNKTLGRILKITDPSLSHSVGQLGLWHPLEFVKQQKNGIFFLQDYDPKKTPVIFFHGIGGSGADLKSLITSIDTNKFQPWVMQYPSGLRIDLIASHSSGEINKLRSKYHFDKYVVIAHSMGGLLARSIIERQLSQKRNVDIPLFISISTPWNGHKAATWGIEGAPVVIPVWFDIAPGSPYLKRLQQQIAKTPVKHHLLFSYKGNLSLINSENNDGTVTLSSELLPIVQTHAEEVYGFDIDHVGILEYQEMLDKVNQRLSEVLF